MIYTYDYFLEKLAEIHPEIEMKSLDIIVKRGLQGVHRVMRAGEELLLNSFLNGNQCDEWIKFYINSPPEVQRARSLKNFYKKQHKKESDAGR